MRHGIAALCAGGLELYFIRSLSGRPTAFSRKTGIVIGPRANARTVSHEIGHTCGLPDIYNFYRGTPLAVYGAPSKDRMVDDWGWYPPSVLHSNIVERLLMYGFRSDAKADISYGDVFGLHYTFQRTRVSQFILYQRDLQIQRELEIKSSFDALTTLLNRGRFFAITEEILRSKPNEYITLCILDLDEFKGINDNLGHQMGDKVIQTVGKTLIKQLGIESYISEMISSWDLKPKISIAGRLGGDELPPSLHRAGRPGGN